RAPHRSDQERQVRLDGAREREETAVPVELPLEVDRALVEERAHDMVRLLDARERLDVRPLDPVLREEAEVADREDAFGPPARQLIECRQGLADECRLTQADGREARAEADVLR